MKAAKIAKELGVSRKEVNQLLYTKPELFLQNRDNFDWSMQSNASFELKLNSGRTWFTQLDFEKALKEQGSPLDSPLSNVKLSITGGTQLLLCSAARVLCLSNQIVASKKTVILDFTGNESTLSYLNRACFFARLSPEIQVLPYRPDNATSELYKANNISLVELLAIDTKENVPERIKHSFIEVFGDNDANKLFTIVAEMVGNVEEHSATQIPGFAGLQCYTRKNKQKSVIVVISDSGRGICATLRPGLIEHFPKIAKQFHPDKPDSDPKLILHAMKNSGLSRTGRGRGAGLNTSREKAKMLNAKITIRQKNFSVHLKFKDGELEKEYWENDLPTLVGTHVVCEFSLTI
ncbi:ATP-binding protein [Pectobacterium parmentieri]|uniref:ATP-binding protein n=1 Tax=Pectobacterium parmentieri TaxID=1905730 RepID=UPI0018DFCF4F|nr:ATP-binding protein [Pectobacterium parmentieri]